ncbi:hypothetical protein [Kribbella sp. NPDC050470]|uniref:hypothetical protein n=1 Tax=unclassified Kribbella TaxID=2644121 RepID=UPI0037901563
MLVEIEALAARLRAQLGDEAVITDRAQRRTYECDGLTHHRVVPAPVVLADTTTAVAATVRLRRALEAGWDPAELTSQYNAAVAKKRAAEAGMAAIEPPQRLTAKDVRAMVDQLGDIGRVLDSATQEDLASLYDALRLTIDYDHRTRVAEVSITPAPRVDSVCVRGGT